jgi:hypothetical protein
MAKGNNYKCVVCGAEYEYCPKCEIRIPNFDKERYCTQEHADIFATLSKHGCNLATAEETYKALGNLEGKTFTPAIQAHIDSIKPAKEPVVEEATAFIKKKKWQDNVT